MSVLALVELAHDEWVEWHIPSGRPVTRVMCEDRMLTQAALRGGYQEVVLWPRSIGWVEGNRAGRSHAELDLDEIREEYATR